MLVVAIHVAPGSRIPVRAVEAVDAEAGKGLIGDRYHGTKHRHVTIQSQELLDRAADDLGYRFDPGARVLFQNECHKQIQILPLQGRDRNDFIKV